MSANCFDLYVCLFLVGMFAAPIFHLCVLVVCCASGADRAPDGGRLSAPGLLFFRTEPVGPDRAFPSDQVRVKHVR